MNFIQKISRVPPHSCRQADVTIDHIKLYGTTFFAESAKGGSRIQSTYEYFSCIK